MTTKYIFHLLVEYSGERDGIGGYECHGYRGYDRGHYTVDDFEILTVEHAPVKLMSKEFRLELDGEMENYLKSNFDEFPDPNEEIEECRGDYERDARRDDESERF